MVNTELAETWTYFPYCFLLDGFQRWLIWKTCDDLPDSVVVEDSGSVPTFDNEMELQRFAANRNIVVETDDETWSVDLDTLVRWLDDPRAEDVNCVQFLLAWNLFCDVATALGRSLRDRDLMGRKAYSKLFWGNNLPAVTPEGCHYEPIWSVSEVVRMHQILRRGSQWFRDATGI